MPIDDHLPEALAAYLASPAGTDRIPATYALSPALASLLGRIAQERGVPVDALVEHMLFKAVRAEQARRLVGERPDPVPASFLDPLVAAAKAHLAQEVAANRAEPGRGDRATRIVDGLEAALSGSAADIEAGIDELRQRAAQVEAQLDLTRKS
jgi:hypothetical protein